MGTITRLEFNKPVDTIAAATLINLLEFNGQLVGVRKVPFSVANDGKRTVVEFELGLTSEQEQAVKGVVDSLPPYVPKPIDKTKHDVGDPDKLRFKSAP